MKPYTLQQRIAICLILSQWCLATSAQTLPAPSLQAIALAYAQGARGNCPTVAITKWVIATYGLKPATGAFSASTNPDHSQALVLADHRIVTITPEEEAIASAHSDFNGRILSSDPTLPSLDLRKEALDQANRVYAALAVLEAGSQLDGRSLSLAAFEHAFRHLDDGGDIDSLFENLGFKIIDDATFPQSIPNIYGSAVHVVFAIHNLATSYNQTLYDEHGILAPILSYDYSNGRHGHRWRYALLVTGVAGTNSTIIRQCERVTGTWGACPDFNI